MIKDIYPFLENFSNAVVIHDTDTNVLFANSSALRFLSLTLEEIKGKVVKDPHWMLVYGDGSALPVEEYPVSYVLRTKKTLENYEVGIYRKDLNKTMWCICNAHPIFEGDEISSVVVNFTDITEVKETREELNISNEFSASLIRNMQDGFSLVDPEGICVDVNPAFCEMLGFAREELVGKGVPHPYWPPEELENIQAAFNKTLLDTNETYELVFMRKNGQRFPVLVSPSSIRKSGEVTNYIATVKDISKIREYTNKLQHAINARDEFISIMSHELKTPLTSIKLLSQISMRNIEKEELREKILEAFEKIEKHTNRMVMLVDDMLDSGRIRSGTFQMKKEECDLVQLVNEVIEKMKPIMENVKTSPQFESTDTITGQWDRYRIEQVITNLLTNAMKYGSGKPVKISLKRSGDSVLLSVQDQGRGISKLDIERIFKRFERAVAANEVSGLGLGLYICEEIVNAHDGKIWVESAGLGRGSTFYVELPTGH